VLLPGTWSEDVVAFGHTVLKAVFNTRLDRWQIGTLHILPLWVYVCYCQVVLVCWLLINPLEDLLVSTLDAARHAFIQGVLRATDSGLMLLSIYDIESREAFIQIKLLNVMVDVLVSCEMLLHASIRVCDGLSQVVQRVMLKLNSGPTVTL